MLQSNDRKCIDCGVGIPMDLPSHYRQCRPCHAAYLKSAADGEVTSADAQGTTDQANTAEAEEARSSNFELDLPVIDDEELRQIEARLLQEYRSELTNSDKPDMAKLAGLAHALAFMSMKGLKWKEFLSGSDRDETLAAYNKEMHNLTRDGGALQELFPDGPTAEEYRKAKAKATHCILLLERKRSGLLKARLVVNGRRQST